MVVAYVARVLGQGTSRLSITGSAILALISFFYIYTVGSYFKVNIYILQNRVTYYQFFDMYIFGRYIDHIIITCGIILWFVLSIRGKARFAASIIYGGLTLIALLANLSALLDIIAVMSIPIVISFLIYNKLACKKKKIPTIPYTNLTINYIAIIGIATGIISIVVSSAPSLFSSMAQSSSSIPIRNYAYEIFLLFSSFSPILILLLVNSFPVKLLIKEFTTIKNSISNNNNNNNKIDSSVSKDWNIKLRTKFIYLSLFMLLSVAITLIPHLPTINRDNQRIGVDTDYYVNWVNALMHSNNVQDFIRHAFVIQGNAGERPLTLIFLFTIVKVVNANPFYILEHVPIILGPALVLVVYFLTRELTSNNNITSLLAAFLTAVSSQILIGIYAGFYANWFALIIGYLSFVFLIKFLKRPNKLNLILYSILIVFLVFTHAYTWSILAIVMSIFLVVQLKLNYYHKRSVTLLLLVILSSVIIDIARIFVTGSTSSGIEQDIIKARGGASLSQFALRWNNLNYTVNTYVGGQFSNFIIFMLGLYWLFRFNLYQSSSIFLVVFLSIGIIPLLFGNWVIQTRILYNIPFQIPAAIALTYIRKSYANGTLIIFPICIWLLAIGIRAVSNFYLIFPS
jgi:hypothetical protein